MTGQYWANAANIVKAGYKSNAFAPLVWFNAIVDPILLVSSYISDEPVAKYFLMGTVCLLIVFSAIMYAIIFFKDANLLQSEKYRIEDKKLDLIAAKGSDIQIEPVNLTTPPKQIEGGQDD